MEQIRPHHGADLGQDGQESLIHGAPLACRPLLGMSGEEEVMGRTRYSCRYLGSKWGMPREVLG